LTHVKAYVQDLQAVDRTLRPNDETTGEEREAQFAQFIVATRGRKVDCLARYTDQTCCSISSILRRCAGR
jgi:hypothetical protein